MGCRMNAGKDNLSFSQKAEFIRLKLLYLCHQITGSINFLRRIHHNRAGSFVGSILKSGLFTGLFLHLDRTSVSRKRCHLARCGNHTVFPLFNIF